MKAILLILLCCFAISRGSSRQFNWDSYKPASMDSIRILHADLLHADSAVAGTDVRISSKEFKYRILAENCDSISTMRDEIKRVCDFWLTGIMRRPNLKDSYLHEVCVKSGDNYYWLATQEPLIAPLKKEVPKGSHFYVYVILIGSIYDELIFSMNEFKTNL